MKEQHEPFKTINVAEFISKAPEEYPFLIHDLILDVGASIVAGDPKTGKSTFARQLAACVVDRIPFLGREIIRPGSVIYLNLEGNEIVVQKHFAALAPKQIHGRLQILSQRMPDNYADGLARLKATINQFPEVRLVVVDTIIKLFRIPETGNDNYVQVSKALEDLEALAKEVGIHIMAIGHVKKRSSVDVGKGIIGSVSYRAGTDTNIIIWREGKMNGPRLIQSEGRGWPGIAEETYLELDRDTQILSLGKTKEQVQEEKAEGKSHKTVERIKSDIRRTLTKNHAGLTTAELLHKDNVPGNAKRKIDVLWEMQESGDVHTVTEGNAILNRLTIIPVETKTVPPAPKVPADQLDGEALQQAIKEAFPDMEKAA